MNDLSACLIPDQGQPATPLYLVDKKTFDDWLQKQTERVRQAIVMQAFKGDGFQIAIIPPENGNDWAAVLGVANVDELSPWCLAKAAETLPEGTYRVAGQGSGSTILGWILGQYSFDRYKRKSLAKGPRTLLTDEPARIEETLLLARATFLVRDLVNTPAADLGPAELEEAIKEIGRECFASINTLSGDELERNYPMIAAVGCAATAARAPRLVELCWGEETHPRIAIVGKGVCFDSGGLDIKTSSGMRLMKKDMGGAAHALALALIIMKSRLPVRLQLLVPAVENAISGAALRPGDVLRSRAGLTVEIGNTDAEGRLILGDALAKASEMEPELIFDFATLTGAARIALGPDLPALFSNNDGLADALLSAGKDLSDPLWRLPLWDGYDEMFTSDIADIGNTSESSFAGAITAALFLRKFVPGNVPWAHFDTFAWRHSSKPGRPKGGDALGLRAAWAVIKHKYAK